MIKGVIFDFNGTLFFDNDKHVKAWGAISRLLRNKDITDEELHKYFQESEIILEKTKELNLKF
jgi:beta-phosphoglucomutase